MGDTTITVHKFGSGVLVEIIGSDEHGDIAAETYEFDVLKSTDKKVTPREEIPSEYRDRVRTVLSEKGYSIEDF